MLNEKYKAQTKYKKKNPSKTYAFNVFLYEKDIINHMENQDNKAGYLRQLVLDDIERQSNNK